MLHAFDTPLHPLFADRSQWLALLARAPLDLLESALANHAGVAPQWLRTPETGLMMVQGRAGGTGARFNLGEVTITRCALRCSSTPAGHNAVGVAYVLGRSHRQAHLAALADALLQEPQQQAVLEERLLEPVRSYLAEKNAKRQARAQSTKVEFFTVAREADNADGDEENPL